MTAQPLRWRLTHAEPTTRVAAALAALTDLAQEPTLADLDRLPCAQAEREHPEPMDRSA